MSNKKCKSCNNKGGYTRTTYLKDETTGKFYNETVWINCEECSNNDSINE
jgi:hypothetical protein